MDFIKLYSTPDSICDSLIDLYWERSFSHVEGRTNGGSPNSKKSTDLCIMPNDADPRFQAWFQDLWTHLREYSKDFPIIENTNHKWGVISGVNIQHYKPGEGYFALHFERDGDVESVTRLLTFMTYLNTVEDSEGGGGTEFPYQAKRLKAIKGTTAIWPADFTHPHRGIISHEKPKTIITGWVSFLPYR